MDEGAAACRRLILGKFLSWMIKRLVVSGNTGRTYSVQFVVPIVKSYQNYKTRRFWKKVLNNCLNEDFSIMLIDRTLRSLEYQHISKNDGVCKNLH